MKDQPSTSENNAVSRGPEYWEHFLDDLDQEDFRLDRPHLISVDELRAAGALDVPPEWRKSLGGNEKPKNYARMLFDEEPVAEEQAEEPGDLDSEDSDDE